MSERYWITGVQLGVLQITVNEKEKKKIVNGIIKKQFIGSYPTEKDKKEFLKLHQRR